MTITLENQQRLAAAAIACGGIVAYPTEGVFGLGCDPANASAVERLVKLKGRAEDKGFILIAASQAQIHEYLAPINPQLQARLDNDWPGPVTWVLVGNDSLSELVRGGRKTLAVRVTAHHTAASLCVACGHALISTSANISGQPPCMDANSIQRVFGNKIDYTIDAPLGGLQKPTPIFDGATGTQLR